MMEPDVQTLESVTQQELDALYTEETTVMGELEARLLNDAHTVATRLQLVAATGTTGLKMKDVDTIKLLIKGFIHHKSRHSTISAELKELTWEMEGLKK